MKSKWLCLAAGLVTILCGLPAMAADAVQLKDLEDSRLDADAFLSLVRGNAAQAICRVEGVRDCLQVAQERCARDLERAGDRCVENTRRLIRVTGVTGQELNATYLADYASCVIDNAAAVHMLDLSAVHACLVAGSIELAQLWVGSTNR